MATRKPLIAGNWKMNLTHLEGIALVQKISFTLPEKYLKHVDVAVFPPFTALRSVQTLIEADKIDFTYGGQDLSPNDSGAYTGDISGIQLSKLGCTYVLVGHSERREYHQESDEPVWAIGTGRVATPADAQEVRGAIRAALAEKYGQETADGIRILYGGSVKSANVAEICAQTDVDGALVGGASLDGTEFATLAANAVGVLP